MATIGIVTAIANPALEAVVIRGLGESADDVQVVRRCVELADVLAVAVSGQARAVVIGDNLAGLDADIIARITEHGVVPIALAETGRPWPARYLFPVVLDATSEPAALAQQIVAAARAGLTVRPAVPAATAPDRTEPGGGSTVSTQRGRIVAVWGPAGAPGRSTVALGIADEIARLGVPTMLVDADPYGGALATMLGLLDESPGIAAACRAAAAGTLDRTSLARICLQIAPQLRILTGISRSDRWPELRPASVEEVLDRARALATVTVIDCGFSLEEDEELVYDTIAPRRNGATTAALSTADEILLVTGCDPVSVSRGVRAAQELRELMPGVAPRIVVNKVRAGVLDGDPAGQLAEAFDRYAGLPVHQLLPLDQKSCDAALLRGRTIAEVAPAAGLRKALGELARTLVPTASPSVAGRRRKVRR